MSIPFQPMVRACHINSPRQKLAINSERNIQNQEREKMGCDPQSENVFAVQPSNCALVAEPVKSPKLDLIQTIQAAMGIAAQQTNALNAGIASRTLRDRTPEAHQYAMTPIATKMSGKLLSLV